MTDRLAHLENENRRLEDEAHSLRRQIAQLEAGAARFKTTISNLEAKARRAQDAEKAAVEQLALAEADLRSPSPDASADELRKDFELWQSTAQCVVACYKQRLEDERAESAAFSEIVARFVRLVTRAVPSVDGSHAVPKQRVAGLQAENERLKLTIADLSSFTPFVHSDTPRAEVVAIAAKLEVAQREIVTLKDSVRKWKIRARDLEDELAVLYRRGIEAREAMLTELAQREAAAQRVMSDELHRTERLREAQVAKLQNRIAELERIPLGATNIVADASVTPRGRSPLLYSHGLSRTGGR